MISLVALHYSHVMKIINSNHGLDLNIIILNHKQLNNNSNYQFTYLGQACSEYPRVAYPSHYPVSKHPA